HHTFQVIVARIRNHSELPDRVHLEEDEPAVLGADEIQRPREKPQKAHQSSQLPGYILGQSIGNDPVRALEVVPPKIGPGSGVSLREDRRGEQFASEKEGSNFALFFEALLK